MTHFEDVQRARGEQRAYSRLWWAVTAFSLGFIVTVSVIWGKK